MDELSFLSNAESEAIEALYRQYKQDPDGIEIGWRRFFQGFEFSGRLMPQADMKPGEFKVIDLINEYRKRGHLFTKTNPVRTRRKYSPSLSIDNFGLTDDDHGNFGADLMLKVNLKKINVGHFVRDGISLHVMSKDRKTCFAAFFFDIQGDKGVFSGASSQHSHKILAVNRYRNWRHPLAIHNRGDHSQVSDDICL